MLLNLSLAVIALAPESGGGSLIDVNPGLIFWTIVTFLNIVGCFNQSCLEADYCCIKSKRICYNRGFGKS